MSSDTENSSPKNKKVIVIKKRQYYLYCINVVVSKGENNSNLYCLTLYCKTGENKHANRFKVTFTVDTQGNFAILKNKIQNHDRDFKEYNYLDIAKGVCFFFLHTKHNCSTKWTEAWFKKPNEGGKETYKMYDCSAKFIKLNAHHFLKLGMP
jgi:LEA14-like dessication related protein